MGVWLIMFYLVLIAITSAKWSNPLSIMLHVFRGLAPAHWLEHKERRGAALLEGQVGSSSHIKSTTIIQGMNFLNFPHCKQSLVRV